MKYKETAHSCSTAAQEALWLQGFSRDLDLESVLEILYIDIKDDQKFAMNGCYQTRTTHIDEIHHLLKEKLDAGQGLISNSGGVGMNLK